MQNCVAKPRISSCTTSVLKSFHRARQKVAPKEVLLIYQKKNYRQLSHDILYANYPVVYVAVLNFIVILFA